MKVEVITKDSFKPYGLLLSQGKEAPDADTEQFAFSAGVAFYEMPGKVTVGVLEGKKRDNIVTSMERHKDTPEILFEISGDSILVVGKADDDSKEVGGIKAFSFKKGDAVMLAPGTWHWVPFPVDAERSITQVIFKNGTSDVDCEIVDMPVPVVLD